jgi:hypothetical protein
MVCRQQEATGAYKDQTDYRRASQYHLPRTPDGTTVKERVGNVYSIHNNLPYAEKLATGCCWPQA